MKRQTYQIKDKSFLGAISRISLFDGIHALGIGILTPMTEEVQHQLDPDYPLRMTSEAISKAKALKDLEHIPAREVIAGNRIRQVSPVILFLLYLYYLIYVPIDEHQQYFSSITPLYSIMQILHFGIPFLLIIHFMTRFASITNKPLYVAITCTDRRLSGIGLMIGMILLFEAVLLTLKLSMGLLLAVFPQQWFVAISILSNPTRTFDTTLCNNYTTRETCLDHTADWTGQLGTIACRWQNLTNECILDGFIYNNILSKWLYCSDNGQSSFWSSQSFDVSTDSWENQAYWDDIIQTTANKALIHGFHNPRYPTCNMNWDYFVAYLIAIAAVCFLALFRRQKASIFIMIGAMAAISAIHSDFRYIGRSTIKYFQLLRTQSQSLELDYDVSSQDFKQDLMMASLNGRTVQLGVISLMMFELYKTFWPTTAPKLRSIIIISTVFIALAKIAPMLARGAWFIGPGTSIVNYTGYRNFTSLDDTLLQSLRDTSSLADLNPFPFSQSLTIDNTMLFWSQINQARTGGLSTSPGQNVLGTGGLPLAQVITISMIALLLLFSVLSSLTDSLTYAVPMETLAGIEKSSDGSKGSDNSDEPEVNQSRADITESKSMADIALVESDDDRAWLKMDDAKTIPGLIEFDYFRFEHPRIDVMTGDIETTSKERQWSIGLFFASILLLVTVSLPIVIYLIAPKDTKRTAVNPMTFYFIIIRQSRVAVIPLLTWLVTYFCCVPLPVVPNSGRSKNRSIGTYITILQCLFAFAYGLLAFWLPDIFADIINQPTVISSISKRTLFDFYILYGVNGLIVLAVAILYLLDTRKKTPIERRNSFSPYMEALEGFRSLERSINGTLILDDNWTAFLKDLTLKFFALPFMYYFCGSLLSQYVANLIDAVQAVTSIGDTSSGLPLFYHNKPYLVASVLLFQATPIFIVVFVYVAFNIPSMTLSRYLIKDLKTYDIKVSVPKKCAIPIHTAVYENELRLNHDLKAVPLKNPLDTPFDDVIAPDLGSRLYDESIYEGYKTKLVRRYREQRDLAISKRFHETFVHHGEVTEKQRERLAKEEVERKLEEEKAEADRAAGGASSK